jgi:hypothetical protein
MVNSARPIPPSPPLRASLPILNRTAFQSCHIVLPDEDKPVSAVRYGNQFFSYFRAYNSIETVQKDAARLMSRGDRVVLTQVRKGLVLWVFEPDAKLAVSTARRSQPNP